MKSLFTLFIIFSIALRPLMPLLDYAVNYHVISKQLCENKSKPELLCNGKCYLKKELANASENQSKNDSRINISGLVDVFIIQNSFNFQTITDTISKQLISVPKINSSYRFSLFSKIFRPPLI